MPVAPLELFPQLKRLYFPFFSYTTNIEKSSPAAMVTISFAPKYSSNEIGLKIISQLTSFLT